MTVVESGEMDGDGENTPSVSDPRVGGDLVDAELWENVGSGVDDGVLILCCQYYCVVIFVG